MSVEGIFKRDTERVERLLEIEEDERNEETWRKRERDRRVKRGKERERDTHTYTDRQTQTQSKSEREREKKPTTRLRSAAVSTFKSDNNCFLKSDNNCFLYRGLSVSFPISQCRDLATAILGRQSISSLLNLLSSTSHIKVTRQPTTHQLFPPQNKFPQRR